jgi:hypothetical protein
VDIDQFVDEPGRLDLVEVPDAFAEALAGEILHLGLVELVLGHEVLNQLALFVGAFPCGRCRGTLGPVGSAVAGRRCRSLLHPVVGGWNKAGLADLLVDVGLEQLVDAGRLGGDIVGGDEFGFDLDAELMGRIAREPQALAVGCDQFDGQGWLVLDA